MTHFDQQLLPVLTCDIHAGRHISPKILQEERELAKSCWWEYRGIHPTNRTLLFAIAYRELTSRFHGKFWDYQAAEFKTGMAGIAGLETSIFPRIQDSEADLKKKKTNLTGLWKARQAADRHGIAYRIYIGAIFDKATLRGDKYLPRPTHLYSDKAQMIALDEQVKEIERYIPDFKNPALLVGSDAPFKRDFDEWLYELGRLKKHSELAYRRMVNQGYITPDMAEAWTVREKTR